MFAFTLTPTVRNVYLYAVCFATLLMMVIGLIQAADGLFGVIYPPPPPDTPIFWEKEMPSGTTLEQAQEQGRLNMEAQQKRDHYYQVRRIVESLIMCFVALPIYLYHWRKIKEDLVVAKP
ncbi:MAG: hypothetical protein HPY50_17150 [Firmicutes bacterium]|nr:hypothetical protein [Bacillota bacterium]